MEHKVLGALMYYAINDRRALLGHMCLGSGLGGYLCVCARESVCMYVCVCMCVCVCVCVCVRAFV
jgi:hypothetical protein